MADVGALAQENETLRSQLEDAAQAYELSQSKKTEIAEELWAAELRVREMEEEQCRTQANNGSSLVQQLRQENEALQRGIDEKENEVDALNYHVEEYKLERGRMQNRLAELEALRADAEVRPGDEIQSQYGAGDDGRLGTTLEMTWIEMKELEMQNVAQAQMLEGQKSALQEARGLQSHLHALQSKCDEYEAEMDAILQQQASYLEHIKRLDNDVLQLRRANAAPAEGRSESVDSGPPAEPWPTQTDALQEDIRRLHAENSQLRAEMAEMGTAPYGVANPMHDANPTADDSALQRRSASLQKENDELYEKIRSLQTQISDVELNKGQLQERIAKTEESETMVEEKLAGLVFANEALRVSAKAKEKQLLHVENELIEKTREVKIQQSQLEKEKSQRKCSEQSLAILKEKLTMSNKHAKDLQEKIKAQANSIEDSTSLEGRAMELNTELEERQMGLEMEQRRLEVAYEQRESECEAIRIQLEDVSTRLHQKEMETKDLLDRMTEYEKEIQGLESKREDEGRRLAKLREEAKSSHEISEAAEKRMEENERDLETARKETDEMRARLEEMTSNHIEKAVAKRTEQLLSEQMRENDYLLQKIKEKDGILNDVCTKYEGMVTLLNTERQEHERETEEHRTRLDTANREVQKLQSEMNSKEEEIKKRCVIGSGLKNESAKWKERASEVDAEKKALEDKLTSMKQNDVSLLEKLRDLETSLSEEQIHREKLSQEMSISKRHIVSLERQKEHMEEERQQMKDSVAKTEAKLSAAVKWQRDQQADLATRENYIGELEASLALRKTVEKERNEMGTKIAALESENSTFEAVVGKLERQLSAKERKISETVAQLKHMTDNEVKFREQLMQSEANHVAKDAYKRLEEDLREQLSAVATLNEGNNALCEQIAHIQTRFDEQTRENTSKERTITGLMEELERCRAIAQSYKNDADKRSKELAMVKTLNEEKNDEYESLMAELQQQNHAMASLDNQVTSLKANQTELEKEIAEEAQVYNRISSEYRKAKEDLASKQQLEVESEQNMSAMQNTIERLQRKVGILKKELTETKELMEEESDKKRAAVANVKEVTAKWQQEERQVAEKRAESEEWKRGHEEEMKHSKSLKAELEVVKVQWREEKESHEKEWLRSREMVDSTSELEAKVQELHREIDGHRENDAQVLKANRVLQSELERKDHQINTLENELERKASKLKQTQGSNQNLTEEVKGMRSNYNDLWSRYEQLVSDSEGTREELERTSTELEDMRMCKTCTNEEKEKLKGEINLVENKLNALNTALDRSRQQREVLLQELTDSQEKSAALECNKEESRQELIRRLVSTEQQLTSLHVAHADLKDEHDTTLEELGRKRSTLERYKERMESQQALLDGIEAKNTGMSKELAMLYDTIKHLKEDSREKQCNLEEQDTELEEKDRQLMELTEKIQQMNDSYTEKVRHWHDQEDRGRTLEQTTDRLKSAVDKLERNLQLSQTKVKEQQDQLTALGGDNARLTHALGAAESELHILAQENRDTQSQLNNATCQYAALARTHDIKTDERNNMQGQLKTMEVKLRALEVTSKSSEDKRTELESKLREVTTDRQTLGDRTDALTAKADSLSHQNAQLEETNNQLEEQMKSLRQENEDTTANCTALADKLSTTTHALNEVRTTLESLQHKQRIKEKNDEASSHSTAILKRRLLRAESDNASFQKEIDRLTTKNKALSDQMEEIQEKASSEMSLRHAELVELRAEVQYYREDAKKRCEASNATAASESGLCSDGEETANEGERLRQALKARQQTEGALRSDLLLTRNKLAVYIKERSKWEQEFKSVLAEIHREKTKNELHQREVAAATTRHQKETEYLQSKVDRLRNEMACLQRTHEQQREAQRETHAIDTETKRMEIEALKRQLSLQKSTQHLENASQLTGMTPLKARSRAQPNGRRTAHTS